MTEPNGGPSESTPLLQEEPVATNQGITEFPSPENVEPAPRIPASQHFKKPIQLLTRFLLIVSPIAAIFCIASAITSSYGPFRRWPWHTIETLQYLALTVNSLIPSAPPSPFPRFKVNNISQAHSSDHRGLLESLSENPHLYQPSSRSWILLLYYILGRIALGLSYWLSPTSLV